MGKQTMIAGIQCLKERLGKIVKLLRKDECDGRGGRRIPKAGVNKQIPIVIDIPTGLAALTKSGLSAYSLLEPVQDKVAKPVRSADLVQLSKAELARWATALEERYGIGEKFEGFFVWKVKGLAGRTPSLLPSDSAKKALQKAITASTDCDFEGYLAVVVRGNKYRAKDVLIMDLANHRWITLNGSKGRAISVHYKTLKEITKYNRNRVAENFPSRWERDHGMVVNAQPIPGILPDAVSFSVDYIGWHVVDFRTSYGRYLDEYRRKAYELNYFVKFFPHEHKLRFSPTPDPDGEFFETVEEATQMLEAQKAGLDVGVKEYHPIIKFKPGTVANVSFKEGVEVFLAEDRAVTENALPHEDAVRFAKDVLEHAQKHPQEVLVLRPLGAKPYTGNITDYIVEVTNR